MMVQALHRADLSTLSSSIASSIFLPLLPAEAEPNSYCKLAKSLKVIQKRKVSIHPTYCTVTQYTAHTLGFPLFFANLPDLVFKTFKIQNCAFEAFKFQLISKFVELG